jgi:hypothetical protein
MPVGNSNTLGLYWLIIFYVETFLLKERMNISDSLHKLIISHRMSFSHYINRTRAFLKFKMAARQRNTFLTIVLKIGTTFLTAALRKNGSHYLLS